MKGKGWKVKGNRIVTPSYLHPTITSMEMITIQKGILPNSLRWRMGLDR
ncbi:MAG: hypothetical protein SWO11_15640 [Thermodesulfobacteriota bacterium]|nr:hypothetical protein [Thermodesulfobacteriota bacterium]